MNAYARGVAVLGQEREPVRWPSWSELPWWAKFYAAVKLGIVGVIAYQVLKKRS